MRRVDRKDFEELAEGATEVLNGLVRKRNGPTQTEYEHALSHMRAKNNGTATGSYGFNRYSQDAVKLALDAMFHGKCAYCETHYARSQPVDVEHYRPKNEIKYDPNHEGYWWLAMDWENLLPSCIDCNRVRGHAFEFDASHDLGSLLQLIDIKYNSENSGKGNFFPLHTGSDRAAFDWANEAKPDLSVERPLLIDPSRQDPDQYLEFSIHEPSVVSAKVQPNGTPSPEGQCSIAVYGLNRVELVQARTKVLRDLELLLDAMTKVIGAQQDLETDFIQTRADRLPTLSGQEKQDVEKELAKLERIAASLKSVEDSILNRFNALRAPEAEYSVMVKTWMEQL